MEWPRRLLRKFPYLLSFWRSWKLERYRLVEPRPTPHGFLLTGHAQMMAGTFEPDETAVVHRLLAKADRFINVGANIGYYVCHAIAAGKPVLAIEPMQRNVQFLLTNIRANASAADVEVLPVAVADNIGVVELYGTGTGASMLSGWADAPTEVSQLAPVSTMDRILEGRFHGEELFFLIDVEGVEHRVLAGARNVLGRLPSPIFMVEISSGEHSGGHNPHFMASFEYFFDAGYEAWTARIPPTKVTKAQLEAIADGRCLDTGTQNFLFARPGSGLFERLTSK